MKYVISLLFVFLILFGSGTATGQLGSDYYLPLKVGNYLKFHTDGGPNSQWAARTTTESIVKADSISGKVYFVEKETEVADDGTFNNVNHFLWLGRDAQGNILLAAFSGKSSNIDSANILPAPFQYFVNESVVPGFSVRWQYSNYLVVDSTISNTETVNVPAGIFTNCIKKSEAHYDSTGNVTFLEYNYFAKGVGMVLKVRTVPDSQAHTNVLISYSAETSVREERSGNAPNRFSLSQNYPNPFNPTTSIMYKVPVREHVTLTVYNVLGERVATLVDGEKAPEEYTVTLDGSRFPSGVYFYRLQVGTFSQSRKMVLVK